MFQKNQCRLTVRKHALFWNKHKYQHSADILVKNSFKNSFMAMVILLYFLKHFFDYVYNAKHVQWLVG